MNALTVRLTVVSLVSVLGLIAMAQARYGRKESQAAVQVSSAAGPTAPSEAEQPTDATFAMPTPAERAGSGLQASKLRPNRLRDHASRQEARGSATSPGRPTDPFQDTEVKPAEYELTDAPPSATEKVRAEQVPPARQALPESRAIPEADRSPSADQPTAARPLPDARPNEQSTTDAIPDATTIAVAVAADDAAGDRYASGEGASHDRDATESAARDGAPADRSRHGEPVAAPSPAAPGPIPGSPQPTATAPTAGMPAVGGQRRLSNGPSPRPLLPAQSVDNTSPDQQGPTPWEKDHRAGLGEDRTTGAAASSGEQHENDGTIEAGTGVPGPHELEGLQAPRLSIEKRAPQEIQVGKECTFLIRVRNTGQLAAYAVTVRDEVPQRTQLILTEPPATRTAGGQLAWQLGTLAAGEETTLEVQLMPLAEGEVGSVATVDFETRASVRCLATKPELVLQIHGPKQVMIGEEARFQIEISNPGSGAATGVILLEDVPEGLRHPAGERLEFEVGTLPPGDKRDLELVLTADKPGKTANLISARGDGTLAARATAAVEVIAPKLTVGIEGPKRRYLERPATYTVSVDNPGTAPAKDVELVAYLPQGMQFVRANNHGHYDRQTHRITWGLEELPPQEKGSVKLVAIPVEAGEQTLRAEGRAAQGLADEVKQTVAVEGLAKVEFTVADLEDPIEVGGETAYEIHVVNQGSKAATQVQVTVALPEQLRPVGASGPSRHTIEGRRILFAPLRRLAPKADTVYRVEVQGLTAGDHRVRVQLATSEVTRPVIKEETTRFYADE